MNPGTRIGSFTVVGPLGRGGMGEVYRATDAKLKREVAIKVLPESFAGDVDRAARFEREAHLLASLNHPNIAAIYGLEEDAGKRYLVLELIEGPTLAQRIEGGPIDQDESVRLALQIAAALKAAHDKGIIHRDLKPDNIKIDAEGRVKVLDFGLAKALAGDDGPTAPAISMSPTITAQMTQAGGLLGTAAYMSPEQARGQMADRRADIWAFGCVLYEMITAQKCFGGATVTDILAAVVTRAPDWTALPAGTSPAVRRLLRRCLERDASRRLHDIADARLDLEEAGAADSEAQQAPAVAASPAGRRAAPWVIAAASVAVALVALAGPWRRSAPPADPPTTAFGVVIPPGVSLPDDETPIFDLSADGRTLVFVVDGPEGRRLHRRTMDRLDADPIPGAEGGRGPALSPDGRWIAFFRGGKLLKIPAEGGTAVPLADAPAPRGASWGDDGWIVFSPTFNTGLRRVSSTGGPVSVLTEPDEARQERTHRWPQTLPGGQWVLFTVGNVSSPGDYDGAAIDAVNPATGERRRVIEGARMARYAAAGHILFQRESSLLTARFDLRSMQPTTPPASLLEGVGGEKSSGVGYWAASGTGLLSYAQRNAVGEERLLVLVDQDGVETELLPQRSYWHPRFSPDGRRIAFSLGTGAAGGEDDLWIYDLDASRLDRLTFGGGSGLPCWGPDGQRIVFSRGAQGDTGIFWKPSDGSGEAEKLWATAGGVVLIPDAFFPDGRSLLITEASGSMDIRVGTIGSDNVPRPLLDDPWGEWGAALSPDGRFIAYTSSESGIEEVFVRDYPAMAGKWQVSSEGGGFPVWSRDGRTIYYARDRSIMAVAVDTAGDRLKHEPGRQLFSGPYEIWTPPTRDFDVGPDGRFVMVRRRIDPKATRQIGMLMGWNRPLP